MLTNFVDDYQHIGIPTDDINKTAEFYESLGFKLKWETVYGGNPVKFLEHGNIIIETYEKDGGATNATGAIDHLALNCTDIVACVKEVRNPLSDQRGPGVPALLGAWRSLCNDSGTEP